MAIASAKIGVSMVDVADCHTTLYYLLKPPAAPALPFASEVDYNSLHQSLATGPQKFADVRSDYSAKILKNIAPAYSNNKYWRKSTGIDDLANFWMSAWSSLLPLECKLAEQIEIEPAQFNLKISPRPAVLLYPFGWSTKVSIRLAGEHSLETLSKFVSYLATTKCIRATANGTKSTLMSLPEYFSRVASGVREDAFGKNQTGDKSADDLIYVTTVMQKSGFSPTSNPDEDEKNVMLRIVSPDGTLPGGPLGNYLYQRNTDEPRDFVMFRKNGRFIWTEDLLDTADRQNRTRLECRHHNALHAMVHAQHLCRLINRALANPFTAKTGLPAIMYPLIFEAANQLLDPHYENASLKALLQGEEAQAAIEKVNALNSIKSS
jgi:hypothetical protein